VGCSASRKHDEELVSERRGEGEEWEAPYGTGWQVREAVTRPSAARPGTAAGRLRAQSSADTAGSTCSSLYLSVQCSRREAPSIPFRTIWKKPVAEPSRRLILRVVVIDAARAERGHGPPAFGDFAEEFMRRQGQHWKSCDPRGQRPFAAPLALASRL
jgi:hypothetical protein